MSALFDIPAQLAMLLSLAAASAPQAPAVKAAAPVAVPAAVIAEPVEGPLQFSERNWLRALYENPDAAGGYGRRVFVTSGGRYYVPTPGDRERILNARNDALLAARLARLAAERNAVHLRSALGHAPSTADLYFAHRLGPEGALLFLVSVSKTPDKPLKASFPELAASLPERGAEDAAQITVGQLYRRASALLREPPRLVAIGLKPSVADASQAESVWQSKVELAGIGKTAQ